MTIPTNQDFATEIRSERLRVIWQTTAAGCVVIFWIVAVVGILLRRNVLVWGVAPAVCLVGCLITYLLLSKNHYRAAVWAYGLGIVGAVMVVMLFTTDPVAAGLVIFILPIIVFMIGLMMSMGRAFLFAAISSVLIFTVSFLNPVFAELAWHQLFAIALTFLSWVLSAQVSGELFQITEWALMNYQRERKTTQALYENREALQKALSRSQVLSEELTETNQELDGARKAAEEAKRFRGQFLANMSHELRTPLNAIIGFSETMLKFPAMYDDVELPKAYQSDMNQIYNSGRQLLSLINDILDLSKVDAGKLEMNMDRVELAGIADAVISTASGLIGEKQIKLERDLPEKLPMIWADEARIRQVLLNLYSNAIKFTDEGTVTLRIRETDEGVRLTVQDSGCGIDPRFHEAIFEEFKQAESSGRDPRSGAGLGLAICRHLLGLMGGRVWVESEVGKGSSFHVLVSVYRDDVTRPHRFETPMPFPLKASQVQQLRTDIEKAVS